MMTDTIADMLTRIRNAKQIYHESVTIPHSKVKLGIVRKLKQEGFIKDFEVVEASPQSNIKVTLKYGSDGEQIIREIHRVSKPSRRVYKDVKTLGKVLDGLGVSIVSTPKGILTDRECREHKVGGEVICIVW
jgi:small subunit ribosomal protein S8